MTTSPVFFKRWDVLDIFIKQYPCFLVLRIQTHLDGSNVIEPTKPLWLT